MTIQMRHTPTGAGLYARDVKDLLSLRKQIEDRIERDIALLDALDGDPDLENHVGYAYGRPYVYQEHEEPEDVPVTLCTAAQRASLSAMNRAAAASVARAAKAAKRRAA